MYLQLQLYKLTWVCKYLFCSEFYSENASKQLLEVLPFALHHLQNPLISLDLKSKSIHKVHILSFYVVGSLCQNGKEYKIHIGVFLILSFASWLLFWCCLQRYESIKLASTSGITCKTSLIIIFYLPITLLPFIASCADAEFSVDSYWINPKPLLLFVVPGTLAIFTSVILPWPINDLLSSSSVTCGQWEGNIFTFLKVKIK